VLYARSIRKNILYGLEAENGIPPEEVSAACQAVYLSQELLSYRAALQS